MSASVKINRDVLTNRFYKDIFITKLYCGYATGNRRSATTNDDEGKSTYPALFREPGKGGNPAGQIEEDGSGVAARNFK